MDMNEQGQPDILSMLASLLQPAEADAASRAPRGPVANVQPDPTMAIFRQLQAVNQQKRMQMEQQANDLRAREIAVREQKAAPKQPQDVNAQLTRIMGGGAEAPVQGSFEENQQNRTLPNINGVSGGVVFRGKTPGTGTPYFGDVAPEFATPEEKAGFENQQRQAFTREQSRRAAAAPQTGPGQISTQRLAQATQLASFLKSQGAPPELVNLAVQNTFPEIAGQKTQNAKNVAAARSEITLSRQKTMADYNDKLQKDRELDKPLPPGTQTQLQYMNDLNNALDTIGTFVDNGQHASMVGPIAGRTYDIRRQIPGQVSAEEATMRQNLENAKDLLLRKRSGAAINEKEADRLAGLLPKETDEPENFKNQFNTFQEAFKKSMESGVLFATITRRQLKDQGMQGQGEQGAPAPVDANTRAQASQLIVKAKQQLGPKATADQIKALARKMMNEQGIQ